MTNDTIDWAELRSSILADSPNSSLPPQIKLPSLPKALLDFQKRAQDPDVDMTELSQIVSSDVGLSTELLKSVNASSSGLRNKVTSVKQALVMFGIRSTLLHFTTSGMKQMMKSASSKLIHFQTFWNSNLERSLFAQEIAQLLGADAELAFTAGMLQDFLLPVITNQLYDDYLDFTEDRDAHSSLVEFERQKFGWDHAQAAAQIMHAWHFPDELTCSVFFHHHGVELLQHEQLSHSPASAVAVSSLLPDALRQENNGLDRLIALEEEWEAFDLLEIASNVDEKFNEIANDTRNHFSFLRLYQNTVKRSCTSPE